MALTSKQPKYIYNIDSFKIVFHGTEVEIGSFEYDHSRIFIEDPNIDCESCENTGLIDPYGAFGLGDGECPDCIDEYISIGTVYNVSGDEELLDEPLFNIDCMRECIHQAIFKAHKIFLKDIQKGPVV